MRGEGWRRVIFFNPRIACKITVEDIGFENSFLSECYEAITTLNQDEGFKLALARGIAFAFFDTIFQYE